VTRRELNNDNPRGRGVSRTSGPGFPMNTEYVIKSRAGRNVLVYQDETRAREELNRMAKRGTTLRLFKVTRNEEELAA
jgi:hypothetical protein